MDILFKRGLTTVLDSYTGQSGEIAVDVTAQNLRLFNGSTVGGVQLLNKSEVETYVQSKVPNNSNSMSAIASLTPPVNSIVLLTIVGTLAAGSEETSLQLLAGTSIVIGQSYNDVSFSFYVPRMKTHSRYAYDTVTIGLEVPTSEESSREISTGTFRLMNDLSVDLTNLVNNTFMATGFFTRTA